MLSNSHWWQHFVARIWPEWSNLNQSLGTFLNWNTSSRSLPYQLVPRKPGSLSAANVFESATCLQIQKLVEPLGFQLIPLFTGGEQERVRLRLLARRHLVSGAQLLDVAPDPNRWSQPGSSTQLSVLNLLTQNTSMLTNHDVTPTIPSYIKSVGLESSPTSERAFLMHGIGQSIAPDSAIIAPMRRNPELQLQ